MSTNESIKRRQCIPIIYTKGTHYDVGFDVGKTFGSLIHSFVEQSDALKNQLLPAYKSPEGKTAYEDTLHSVKIHYPQYVRELEGIADGAKIPFYILFLFHMDRIILTATETLDNPPAVGCSSICLNEPEQEILGHTEDAVCDILNHFYFVSAHIIPETPQGKFGVVEEKFTSLCYAGHLPGYTMSYNHHGLIFSINTLSATKVYPGKIPRYFITRALLSAENFKQVQEILINPKCGAADGCSINMTFLNEKMDRIFYNAEIGPSSDKTQSQLNILTINRGEFYMHCNAYLRLKIQELSGDMKESSIARMETLKKFPTPKRKEDLIKMLGDQSGIKYRVFQESGLGDRIKTVAVGIFDCKEKTWSIYADNPQKNDPIVVLPLILK